MPGRLQGFGQGCPGFSTLGFESLSGSNQASGEIAGQELKEKAASCKAFISPQARGVHITFDKPSFLPDLP
jgi:hypothetical protein